MSLSDYPFDDNSSGSSEEGELEVVCTSFEDEIHEKMKWLKEEGITDFSTAVRSALTQYTTDFELFNRHNRPLIGSVMNNPDSWPYDEPTRNVLLDLASISEEHEEDIAALLDIEEFQRRDFFLKQYALMEGVSYLHENRGELQKEVNDYVRFHYGTKNIPFSGLGGKAEVEEYIAETRRINAKVFGALEDLVVAPSSGGGYPELDNWGRELDNVGAKDVNEGDLVETAYLFASRGYNHEGFIQSEVLKH